MAFVRVNSNNSIEDQIRRPGDTFDLTDWRPWVNAGTVTLIEREEHPPPSPDATTEQIGEFVAQGIADGSIEA